MRINTKTTIPSIPSIPCGIDGRMGWNILSPFRKGGNPMEKPYYKELPLFHIYDSNLTGSQKLLMTLLLIDNAYDIYTLSCLAKLRTEDVIFDLQELKKRGYFQDR